MKYLKKWKFWLNEEAAEDENPEEDTPTDDAGGDDTSSDSAEGGVEGENIQDDDGEIYTENPEYRVDLILTEIIKKIKYWFKYGEFKRKKYFLEDIDRNLSLGENNVRANIQFSSDKDKRFYNLQIMIRVTDAINDILDTMYVELKMYDKEDAKLKATWMNNIKISNFIEDYLFKKIKKLKDRQDDYEEPENQKDIDNITDNTNDLKDNVF